MTGISVSNGVSIFQNTQFKVLEFQDRIGQVRKMEWLFVFKVKQEMYIVTPN